MSSFHKSLAKEIYFDWFLYKKKVFVKTASGSERVILKQFVYQIYNRSQ